MSRIMGLEEAHENVRHASLLAYLDKQHKQDLAQRNDFQSNANRSTEINFRADKINNLRDFLETNSKIHWLQKDIRPIKQTYSHFQRIPYRIRNNPSSSPIRIRAVHFI